MQVKIKIEKVKKNKFTVKAKTYDEARDFLINRGSAACYMANPTYNYAKNKDGQVTSITIISKPAFEWPDWPGASKLKGDEKKHWDKMIKALGTHENGHVKIFETDAKAFKKSREKDGDFPVDDVKGVMFDFFSESQKHQDAYDKKTKHGQTQGVVLP